MFNQVKSRTHFDFKVKRNEIQLSLISRVDVGDVYRKKTNVLIVICLMKHPRLMDEGGSF